MPIFIIITLDKDGDKYLYTVPALTADAARQKLLDSGKLFDHERIDCVWQVETDRIAYHAMIPAPA